MAKILALTRDLNVVTVFAPKIVNKYEVLFRTERADTVNVIKEMKTFFVERNLKYKSFEIRKKDSEADFPLYYSYSSVEIGAEAAASMEFGDRALIYYGSNAAVNIGVSKDTEHICFKFSSKDEKTADEFYRFIDSLGKK